MADSDEPLDDAILAPEEGKKPQTTLPDRKVQGTSKEPKKKGFAARPWVRAAHRDIGYVAVGLTVVYALSGLSVNHLTDWKDGDANFQNYSREVDVAPLPTKTGDAEKDDRAVSDAVRAKFGIAQEPREVYRIDATKLDVTFDKRTVHVDLEAQRAIDEGQKPRFFLRAANWLHLNRGKKQWTYVADAYAVGLLVLALSGIFMIPGKKGFLGRGAVLVGIGIAIPVVYVTLSGGP